MKSKYNWQNLTCLKLVCNIESIDLLCYHIVSMRTSMYQVEISSNAVVGTNKPSKPAPMSVDILNNLHNVFDKIDANGDGELNVREMILGLRKNGELRELLRLPQYIRQEDGTRDDFERLFSEMDASEDRSISFNEFSFYIMKHMQETGHPDGEGLIKGDTTNAAAVIEDRKTPVAAIEDGKTEWMSEYKRSDPKMGFNGLVPLAQRLFEFESDRKANSSSDSIRGKHATRSPQHQVYMDDLDELVPIMRPQPLIPMSELLAKQMVKMRTGKLAAKAFYAMRNDIFRILYAREDKLSKYLLHVYLARRFYAWQRTTRINAVLGKAVRQHWRRKRRHRFFWWKYVTRWLRFKQNMGTNVISCFWHYKQYQQLIFGKWAYFRRGLAAKCIQRVFTRFRFRRLFWAMVRVKYATGNHWGLKIIRMRKHHEMLRLKAEQETVDILLRRAQTALDDILNDDEQGELYLTQYLQSVAYVQKQIQNAAPGSRMSNARVFPSTGEEAGIALCWTTRSKAMHVLKLRIITVVTKLARRRFRHTYPPKFECKNCHHISLQKKEHLDHNIHRCQYAPHHREEHDNANANTSVMSGKDSIRSLGYVFFGAKDKSAGSSSAKYWDKDPNYVCWKLAQPMVDLALVPLQVSLTLKP